MAKKAARLNRELKDYQKERKKLERELKRKEKALAEAAALLVLFAVSRVQEKMSVRDWIARQHITIRWGLALGCIAVIIVFGTYGFGYDAQAFIYGGF